MADNVQLNTNATSGETIRTDDDGTAQWQYVKIAWGADNTQNIVGSISSNPFPVALSTTDNAVLDNILTAVQVIDDTVYVDDADWTATSSSHTLIGGVYQSTPGTITDGDTGPFRVDANGAIHINDGGNAITIDWAGTAPPIGAGVEATALRVTLATDSTGLISVDDNGASLTVDNGGTFVVQEDGAALTALQIIDNSIFVDDAAFTLTSSSVTIAGAIRDDSLTTLTAVEDDAVPLRVNSTGALHVTGGGGGTEYTEDVATANPIVGTATLIERDDALSAVTPIEGDWIGLRGSAEGALWVQDFNSDAISVDTGVIASDTTSIDGKITACNTGAVVISSGTVTTVSTVTNLAQMGGVAISLNTGVRDTGTQRVTIATNDSLAVTNAGTFVIQEDGAALTALQVIDNIVHVDDAAYTLGTDSGVMMMGFAGTQSVNADDAAALACETDGSLHIHDGGNTITVDGTVSVDLNAGTNTNEVVGDVAHDAAAAGNPVLIAARATASMEGITEVAEADSTFLAADLSGALITRAACAHAELVSFHVANTDGAEDAVTSLDDGGAAIYNFITSVTIHNAHATTNGFVTLLDGSGGTVFWTFPAPALGGTTHNFDPPLRQPTISTALYVDVSAAITTMYISINGYQGNG